MHTSIAGYYTRYADTWANDLAHREADYVLDLNQPVYEFLFDLDPLVSPNQSLVGFLTECEYSWTKALDDRLRGHEVRRLVTQARSLLLETQPDYLREIAEETLSTVPDTAVAVLGIASDKDAQWIHSLGGRVFSIDPIQERTVLPLSGPISTRSIDEYIPTPHP